MGNRGSATLMFGAPLDRATLTDDDLRAAWDELGGEGEMREPSLYTLCSPLGLTFYARGYADNGDVVIGHEMAHAYSVDVAEVASLDVPDDARSKVARLLAALGVTEAARVLLVAGHE